MLLLPSPVQAGVSWRHSRLIGSEMKSKAMFFGNRALALTFIFASLAITTTGQAEERDCNVDNFRKIPDMTI